MTDTEKQEIIAALKAESTDIGSLSTAESLDGLASLPATDASGNLVAAPITLLSQPATEAATEANEAATKATEAAALATAATTNANKAATSASNITQRVVMLKKIVATSSDLPSKALLSLGTYYVTEDKKLQTLEVGKTGLAYTSSTPNTNTIYVDTSTNKCYRYDVPTELTVGGTDEGMVELSATDLSSYVTNEGMETALTDYLKAGSVSLSPDVEDETEWLLGVTNKDGSEQSITVFTTDAVNTKLDDYVTQTALSEALQGLGGTSGMGGTIDVTASYSVDAIKNAVNNLSAGSMVFFMITDSKGAAGSGSVTFNEDVAKYVTSSPYVAGVGAGTAKTSLGASVGDLLAVIKFKVLLVTYTVIKVFPMNDAKAASGDFPGCDGLETVWDKTQVNKIPSIESTLSGKASFYTKGDGNMNTALTGGFYPWCTLGRPSGSDGAFTLKVVRSADADGNGYYTVEQTAYGRSGNVLGRVFYRYVFVKADGTTDFTDWVQIGGDAIEVSADTVTEEDVL